MPSQTLTFGPFSRSVSSVEGHLCPEDGLAVGSYNYLVDPVAGGVFKRSGFSTAGYAETLNAGTLRATAGLLASDAVDYVPTRLRSFKSDALANGASGGYPTASILYRKEASSTSWPTVDDGVFGTEYVRRSGANYTLLSEYGATQYPTTGGALGSEILYKVAPFWYESGDGGYSRGATQMTRRFVASGSWDTMDAGRWRYYPNLRGTPLRWDGGCNDNTSGTNSIRVMPTGPWSPPWVPTATATTSIAAASRTAEYPWQDGDTFYYSVLYQFEDGSYSLPAIPRQTNSILTSGLGLYTVGTPGAGFYWKSVVYTGIPIGPAGTIARALVRSRKMNKAAATDNLTIDISDLRIFGVLRNNTQTTFTDTLADDDGLLLDQDVVRFDLICPPRARHIGTGDNRAIVGYTLPNPAAMEICIQQVGATAYDMNVDESNAGNSAALGGAFAVDESNLYLYSTNAGAALVSTVTIDFATYSTIQSVCDKINATARDGTHVAFRAQLAPGADPTASSTGLARTVITSVSSTSAASTTLTVDAATGAAVPIGYKIYDSAGKIPAGTYVVSKQSATQLTMSAAASGAGSAAALKFYCDTGDNSMTNAAGTVGLVRCFGPALPSFIYFKRSALVGYDRPARDRLYFTSSSPGAASTGVSLAPNSFIAGNRRDGVNNPGQVMGIVDVQGAAVVAYRKRIALFVNERGNNTAEDFDYRIVTINDSRGCTSPWGLVAVNGSAVYPTPVGIVATDKSRREILLTSDVYQPIRDKGDMAYEFKQCVAASAADVGTQWMSGTAWGNRLVYSWRSDATHYRFSVYDFSLGTDAQGLDSLANPETRKPYGWSSPCILDVAHDEFGPQAMGAVSASDGLRLYGAINDNYGTDDGRFDQMFTGATDNGGPVSAALYTKTFVAEPGTRYSAQNMTVLHKVDYDNVSLSFSRVSGSTSQYLVSNSGAEDYALQRVQLKQSDRSPAGMARLFVDDSIITGQNGLLWRVDVDTDVLERVGG